MSMRDFHSSRIAYYRKKHSDPMTIQRFQTAVYLVTSYVYLFFSSLLLLSSNTKFPANKTNLSFLGVNIYLLLCFLFFFRLFSKLKKENFDLKKETRRNKSGPADRPLLTRTFTHIH
jgi:hypothetical protein